MLTGLPAGVGRLVRPLRRFAFIFIGLAALVTAAACSGASGASRTATPAAPAPTSATPASTARTATAPVSSSTASAPASGAPDLSVFRNFIYPIKGACLPSGDQLMPNAPRPYRDGVHEGIDFYGSDSCTTVEKGTPVLAAKDGVVIRADRDYTELTQAQLDAANQRIADGYPNDFAVLDLFRGRQVWIDHGNGIVTRYAHLSGVADGVEVGAKVVQGQTIAFVGESGTPESITNPGTENHLQFELRTGDSYLGEGLPPDEVRALYENLFKPLP